MSHSNAIICLLTLIGVLVNPRLTAAQNLRELAREQARTNPGAPVNHPAAPNDYQPKTIEELTKEADVVLQATLSQMNSYLTPNAERVLTDYSIQVERVIAGSLPPRQTLAIRNWEFRTGNARLANS